MAQATARKTNAKRSTTAKQRGPKAADSKGFQGHALATLVIAQATKTGELMLAQVKSRKQVLADLMQFRDNAEHIEFRKMLDEKLDSIKKEAEKAKLSLNAWCDANPVDASIRVDCSLWVKMSTAVEKGFNGSKVDLDKPWPEISKAATAHLDNLTNSTGTNGKTTNAGPKQKKAKAGRKAKGTVQKAQEFAASVLKDPVTKAPLPKDNRNLAQVVATIILDATLEELNEVAAVVQRQIEYATKAKAQADDAAKKAAGQAKNMHDAAMTKPESKGKGRKAAAGTPTPADKLIEEGKAIAAGPVGRAFEKRRSEKAHA